MIKKSDVIKNEVITGRGCPLEKSVVQAERAWFPSEARKSEAEHRVAISTLGKSTASFRSGYPLPVPEHNDP
jgi:hypothetical protein